MYCLRILFSEREKVQLVEANGARGMFYLLKVFACKSGLNLISKFHGGKRTPESCYQPPRASTHVGAKKNKF